MFSQNGMRQDEIGRERDKRILDPNSAHTRPGGANPEKKQQKNSKNQRRTFLHYFQPNLDETGREREKRILDPNSAHTRRGAENSEKKSKKIQKIKKQLSGVSFSQNGIRQDEIGHERDKRMLNPNSAHTRPGGENSEKKFKKNQKIKKTTFRRYFQSKRDEIG